MKITRQKIRWQIKLIRWRLQHYWFGWRLYWLWRNIRQSFCRHKWNCIGGRAFWAHRGAKHDAIINYYHCPKCNKRKHKFESESDLKKMKKLAYGILQEELGDIQ